MDRGEMTFDLARMWLYLSITATVYMGMTSGAEEALKTIGIALLIPVAVVLLFGVLWLIRCILELIHFAIFG